MQLSCKCLTWTSQECEPQTSLWFGSSPRESGTLVLTSRHYWLGKSPTNISNNMWTGMLSQTVNGAWRLVEPSLQVPLTPTHEDQPSLCSLCFPEGEAAIPVPPMPGLQHRASWLIEEKNRALLPSHSQKHILWTLTAHCKTSTKSESLSAPKLKNLNNSRPISFNTYVNQHATQWCSTEFSHEWLQRERWA